MGQKQYKVMHLVRKHIPARAVIDFGEFSQRMTEKEQKRMDAEYKRGNANAYDTGARFNRRMERQYAKWRDWQREQELRGKA